MWNMPAAVSRSLQKALASERMEQHSLAVFCMAQNAKSFLSFEMNEKTIIFACSKHWFSPIMKQIQICQIVEAAKG